MMKAAWLTFPAIIQLRRKIILPSTGWDWVVLFLGALCGVGSYFLLKHFFPNLTEKTVTTICTVIAALIMFFGGYTGTPS